MQELEYRLVKEDYKSWIRWNVRKHESKRLKLITIALYVVFLAVFLSGNLPAAQGDMVEIAKVIGLALIVGAAMLYLVSNSNQERMIWSRTGLKKMDKAGKYPTIHVQMNDQFLIMTSVGQDVKKTYSYRDIECMEEIERLFLLKMSDQTWQFVATSAFADQAAMDEFKAFIEAKMADAKEHPERYPDPDERKKEKKKAAAGRAAESIGDDDGDDEAMIAKVDTSRMGKIGKMAHIVASRAGGREEEPETAEEAAAEPETAEGTAAEAAASSAAGAAEAGTETAEEAAAAPETAEETAEVPETAAEPEIAAGPAESETAAEVSGDEAEKPQA